MTLAAIASGFYYPSFLPKANLTNIGTMDAATEKIALIGRCYIAGRPGGTKTISAAGGGSISFGTGTTTFANGSTTLDIGIQDVEVTTGNPVRPDGTFDVKRTLMGGTDTINTQVGTRSP